MSNLRQFARCDKCGKIIGIIKDGAKETICCGEPMKLLVPNSVDAANEKHVPKLTLDGDKLTVEVGEVAHPMTDEHFIEWITVAQDSRTFRQILKPGDEPKAVFCLQEGHGSITVYAYCNLHGLWEAKLD